MLDATTVLPRVTTQLLQQVLVEPPAAAVSSC